MLGPSVFLLVIGLLGAFDIAWFHTWKGRLVARAECRTEAGLHVGRGIVYAVQFLVVPSVELHGRWIAALAALFVVDATIAMSDILVEPASRAAQGGIARGEYLVHMVLSVLVGAMLHGVGTYAVAWASLPTAVVASTHVPAPLRAFLSLMAVGSAGCALVEAALLRESRLPPAAPLHVRVRLRAPLADVWNITQDHRLHPLWDHRFDRIVMKADRIETGTEMDYEKTVLGLTIRGHGRYKLHRPLRQSTFEFGSDDPRSLIARGVGLWLYTALPDGRTELSTSYTYEPRWGVAGRLLDRLVFRPLFQRYTEASFRRLARRFFAEPRARVLGRAGRRPARFAAPVIAP